MKRIAVLIPTYKPKEYLEKCLKSLNEQTLEKSEYRVYLVLNGPKEPYKKMIQNILANLELNYELIYSPQIGVAHARNRLLAESNEEFIAFVDDDDVISENYLEELLKVSSETDMGISNIVNFSSSTMQIKENYIGKAFQTIKDGETRKMKIRKYFSSPCAKLLHRKMIGDVQFDTNVFKSEDALFMAVISKNIACVKKASSSACYYVYERCDSTSRKPTPFIQDIKFRIYLVSQFVRLLFSYQYDKLFIFSRIIATLKKKFTFVKIK